MATEIENLRARKERLIDELQDEEHKEKSLQEDIEILEEKIEIRDFEKSSRQNGNRSNNLNREKTNCRINGINLSKIRKRTRNQKNLLN